MKVGTIVRMKLTDRLGIIESRFWFFGWRVKVFFPEEVFTVEKEYQSPFLFRSLFSESDTKTKTKEKYRKPSAQFWTRIECVERTMPKGEEDRLNKLMGDV